MKQAVVAQLFQLPFDPFLNLHSCVSHKDTVAPDPALLTCWQFVWVKLTNI